MPASTRRLRGILITHDHADHVAGLRVLAKQLSIPVYATAGTLERLAAMVEPTTRLLPLEEIQEVAGMQVQPFATQHDASDSCGFRITAGSRTIGFVTDLGLVTPQCGSTCEAATSPCWSPIMRTPSCSIAAIPTISNSASARNTATFPMPRRPAP